MSIYIVITILNSTKNNQDCLVFRLCIFERGGTRSLTENDWLDVQQRTNKRSRVAWPLRREPPPHPVPVQNTNPYVYERDERCRYFYSGCKKQCLHHAVSFLSLHLKKSFWNEYEQENIIRTVGIITINAKYSFLKNNFLWIKLNQQKDTGWSKKSS